MQNSLPIMAYYSDQRVIFQSLNICKINNIIGHSVELVHKGRCFLTSVELKKERIYQTALNRDACPKGILNGSQFGLLPPTELAQKPTLSRPFKTPFHVHRTMLCNVKFPECILHLSIPWKCIQLCTPVPKGGNCNDIDFRS